MKAIAFLTALLMSSVVLASGSTDKQLDTIQNSTGGSLLAVPSVGSTLDTNSNTLTLTNKSLSGSSNTFTNIPASAVSSGQLAVANGGTGDSTLTLSSVLVGNGTSAVSQVGPGTQYQVFQAGASGVPAFSGVHLDQSAAVSGQLGVANGGTGASTLTAGSVVIGNGTSAVSLVAPGTSGNVLTSNGSTFISAAPAGVTPSLNGGSASPQVVTAVGGISLSGIAYSNFVWVAPASAVTVTATPSITACTADAQILRIYGTSNTNTLTLQDQANLASSGLSLNGNWTGAKDSALTLHCDITQGLWVEDSRSN